MSRVLVIWGSEEAIFDAAEWTALAAAHAEPDAVIEDVPEAFPATLRWDPALEGFVARVPVMLGREIYRRLFTDAEKQAAHSTNVTLGLVTAIVAHFDTPIALDSEQHLNGVALLLSAGILTPERAAEAAAGLEPYSTHDPPEEEP